MKGVQCYELFGGIALKNHTFSFFFIKVIKTILTDITKIKPIPCTGITNSLVFTCTCHNEYMSLYICVCVCVCIGLFINNTKIYTYIDT